jgi:hypothetical protein
MFDLKKIKERWDYQAKLNLDKAEALAKKNKTAVYVPMVSKDRKDVWALIEQVEILIEKVGQYETVKTGDKNVGQTSQITKP